MNETRWLWLGCFGMVAGAAALALGAKHRTEDEEDHSIAHILVPIIAASSYFAMATHQGEITLADGRSFLYARYVDWFFTTPLLLVALAQTGLGGELKRRPGLVLGLIGADIYMIVTGVFAGLSPVGSTMKWVWYIASCGGFLAVYYGIWVRLKSYADAIGGETKDHFTGNAMILSVLWFAYPLVFLFGPEGTGVMTALTATAAYTLLDLAAKVGYGLVAEARSRARTRHDLASPGAAPSPVRLA